MKKMNNKAVLVFLLLSLITSCIAPLGVFAENTITINYAENPELITKNPGKGWIRYGTTNKMNGDPVAEKKLAYYSQTGYGRWVWSAIEPEEGVYNWEPIDDALEYWDSIGAQFAFGFMIGYTTPDSDMVDHIPPYVWEAGAKYQIATHTNGNRIKTPINDDPIYLEKLDKFLKAVAERYDNDDRVSYIDARIQGIYGEGHNAHMTNAAPLVGAQGQIALLDCYVRNFKNTQLMPTNFLDAGVYDYLKEHNIGVRNDGVLDDQTSVIIQKDIYGYGPTVSETAAGGYGNLEHKVPPSSGYRYWNVPMYYDAIRLGKLNYIDIGQWGTHSEAYVREMEPMIRGLTNRMGYHFVLNNTSIPKNVADGESFDVTMNWSNKGINYLYMDCMLDLAVIDEAGDVVERYRTDITPTRKWESDTTFDETANIKIGHLNDGKYRLAVGLFRNDKDDKADYEIGNYGKIKNGWYVISDIEANAGQYTFSFDRDELFVNGRKIQSESVVKNGKKYLPIKNVFYAMDSWIDVDGNKITAELGNDKYSFDLSNDVFKINGAEKVVANATVSKDGVAYFNAEILKYLPAIVEGNKIDTFDYLAEGKAGIIRDSGFEKHTNAWSYEEPYCRVTDETSHSGTYSMKIDNSVGENKLYQLFASTGDRIYELSFFAKGTGALNYFVKDPSGVVIADGKIQPTDDFVEYKANVSYADVGIVALDAPYNPGKLSFEVVTTGEGGTAYIDDVKLSDKKMLSEYENSENLICDYDMEVEYTGWLARNKGVVYRTREDAYQGEWSMITNRQREWRGFEYDITDIIEQNGPGKYRFEAYVKTGEGQGEMQLSVGDVVEYYSKPRGSFGIITPTINEEWQKISTEFEIKQENIDGQKRSVLAVCDNGETDLTKEIMLDSASFIKID